MISGEFVSRVTAEERRTIEAKWAELARAGQFTPFRPGDGWKYVAPRFERLPNGGSSLGLTSEECILILVDRWLQAETTWTLPALIKWLELDDYAISAKDMASMQAENSQYLAPVETLSLGVLIDDLTDVNMHKLAGEMRKVFATRLGLT